MTLLIANTFISISATCSSDDVIVIKHITSANSFVVICHIQGKMKVNMPVRYKAKAAAADFFSNILPKPDVTYNTISLTRDPAPRRSLR